MYRYRDIFLIFWNSVFFSTASLTIVIYLFSSLCFFGAFAQNSSNLTLTDIEIIGNRWTRDHVILRELSFKINEQYSINYLEESKEENLERLKSLGIFNDVVMEFIISSTSEINSSSQTIKCLITLRENWYIYPSLIFELSDRNFTDWWVNQNHDFSRINYGLRLDHINLTGSRDKLIVQLQSGFRKKYELIYNRPAISKDGKWGAEASVFYATQDQIAYKTVDNKTLYGGNEKKTMISRLRSGGTVFYRPTIYQHHAFRLEFHKNSVDQYVIDVLNPDYFLDGKTSIKFFHFNYFFTYDRRVSQFYPIGGYQLFFDIKKEGFKIFDEYNNLSLAAGAEYYKKLNPKLIFGTTFKFKVNLDRSTVSFANNTGLGWGGDSFIGYSLYVVDGTDFIYSKNNLRYQLFKHKYDITKYLFLKQFQLVNVQLHTRLFFETGYVNDRTYRQANNNNFSNRWLFSYGTAFDLILFNNNMASFNLGFNHLNEFGYVFQYRTSF